MADLPSGRPRRHSKGTLCLPGTLIGYAIPSSPQSPDTAPASPQSESNSSRSSHTVLPGSPGSNLAPSSLQSDSNSIGSSHTVLAGSPGPILAHPPDCPMKEYVNKKVCVLTTDGRTLIGNLLTADQVTNLVLSETKERIIQSDGKPSFEVEHAGLYILRGDNVLVVGELDVDLDKSIDWTNVHGAAIGGIKHS